MPDNVCVEVDAGHVRPIGREKDGVVSGHESFESHGSMEYSAVFLCVVVQPLGLATDEIQPPNAFIARNRGINLDEAAMDLQLEFWLM